jgi:hypothetical protein
VPETWPGSNQLSELPEQQLRQLRFLPSKVSKQLTFDTEKRTLVRTISEISFYPVRCSMQDTNILPVLSLNKFSSADEAWA